MFIIQNTLIDIVNQLLRITHLYNRRNSTWLLVDIATSLRRKGIFMIASVLH